MAVFPTEPNMPVRFCEATTDAEVAGCFPVMAQLRPHLTAEEFAVVKRHPAEGVRIVEPLRSLRATIPLIRWHHERANGTGYPDGLAGDAIPRAARIVAVADVYDALHSHRPYRPAMTHEESLRVMRADAAEGGLDPQLVEELASELKEAGS